MIHKLLSTAALVAAALPAVAGTGVFGSYLAFDADGAGPVPATWLGAQQPGANTLLGYDGFYVGTFMAGATFSLAGGELLTWKNGGGDVTGAVLHWRVDGGGYQDLTLAWAANATFTDRAGNAFSTSGDQRWVGVATPGVNVLAGVAPGNHTLQVYFTAFTNEGNRDSGTAASPFSATFTVVNPAPVPEPATAALWLAGIGLTAVLRRRRA